MIIPAVFEIDVIRARVRSGPLPGTISASSVPVPSRLRKRRSVSVDERAADVAREPAAGLERGLQEHAERHRRGAVLLEVPGVRRARRTRPRRCRPACMAPISRVDPRDARHEVVRRPRQARDAAGAVEARGRSGRTPSRAGPTRRRAATRSRRRSRRPTRPASARRGRPARRARAAGRARPSTASRAGRAAASARAASPARAAGPRGARGRP